MEIMTTMLEDAVAHIRAGNIERVRPLLIEFLKQNPQDEDAWLWMTRCVTEPDQKKYCFEKVLQINTQNQYAIKGLEWLSNPVASKTQPKAKVVQPQPVKKVRLNMRAIIALIGLATFLCGACGIFLIIMLNSNNSSAREDMQR